MATIYRNKKDGRLYYLYKVSPRGHTGSHYEAEHLYDKERRKLNNSSFKRADFIPLSHYK